MDDMLKVMVREMEAKKHIKEKGYDMREQHDAHVQFAIDCGRLDYTVTKSGKVNYFVI